MNLELTNREAEMIWSCAYDEQNGWSNEPEFWELSEIQSHLFYDLLISNMKKNSVNLLMTEVHAPRILYVLQNHRKYLYVSDEEFDKLIKKVKKAMKENARANST